MAGIDVCAAKRDVCHFVVVVNIRAFVRSFFAGRGPAYS